MLIKPENNNYLINIDNISRIFRDGNNGLVCVVPSATSNTGYEQFVLLSSGAEQYHLKSISALYKQYVITETGELFIPPKVYEISNDTNAITARNVSINFVNGTGRLSVDNKVSYGFNVYHNGKLLVEGLDYITILPLYKGTHQTYRFIFYFIQSRSYYYYSLTINDDLKSVGSDVSVED
jgi:hypothetical protein